MIGASLEAKVLLYVADEALRKQLHSLNPDSLDGNGVDELRYLFISSQVELLDSPQSLENLQYKLLADNLGVGVVKADGEKCERCWNYSTHVGESSDNPTICERCDSALVGKF